jgi:hypothetical protein
VGEYLVTVIKVDHHRVQQVQFKKREEKVDASEDAVDS